MRWHWHCWQPGFGAEMSSWSGKRPCVSAWSASALAERSVIQALSAIVCNSNLAGFLSGRIYQGEWKSVCLPGLNCYSCPGAIGACPIGSLQSFFSGTVLRFPFYVLGWLLLLGLVFGRWICGWLCPFGWLQDILYRVPLPKYGKTRLTYRLSRLKRIWAVLFVVMLPLGLWLVSGIGEPAFCEYLCPAGTLEAAVPLLLVNDSLADGPDLGGAGVIPAGNAGRLPAVLPISVPAWCMVWSVQPAVALGGAGGCWTLHGLWALCAGLQDGCPSGR